MTSELTEVEHQTLGMLIYKELQFQLPKELWGKITGMILELKKDRVLELLNNKDELLLTVNLLM
jgi:hypothetical protein